MAEKYLMFSLDDPRTAAVADAINNKTCKKILEYLAEREATETEIAHDLNIPANTVNYDVKKLLNSGLIEKSSEFFWSVKGKKMPKYKVSNKKIIISPKNSKMKNFLITVLLTGVVALVVKFYSSVSFAAKSGTSLTQEVLDKGTSVASSTAASSTDSANEVVREAGTVLISSQPIWLWFLLGGLTALMIYLLLSWKKL